MKNKMRKVIIIGLCGVMGTALLTGCGGDDGAAKSGSGSGKTSKSDAGNSGDGDQITLKVVDWESDEMNAAMQDAFDNVFTKEHPNIKVEIVEGSYSDYGQQMTGMITAGEAPDVFQGGYDMGASFYKKNLLYDWSDKAEEEPDFVDSFYEGTMDGWHLDGKTYGFPGLVNTYGVFYNKDLLKAAGVGEPAGDWTWDDFFNMAEELKDPSQNKFGAYGFDSSCFGIANVSTSYGGEPMMDKIVGTSKVTVDDEFLNQAERVQGLIKDGTLPERTYETANLNSMFEAGEMALLYFGQWEADTLIRNTPDFEWGYAPTPRGSKEKTTIYDTIGWMSPKNTEHPEETWELIKFMSSEMYDTVLKETPVAPCAYADSASVFYDVMKEHDHPEAADAVKQMMETEQKNGIRFADDWSSDVGKVWDPTFNDIMDGKSREPLTKLQDITKKINQIIEGS